MMELKEAFETALAFEARGHEIYQETAKKTKNHVVSKTFQYLAEQEMKHISDIQQYLSGKLPDIDSELNPLTDAQKFFGMTINEFKEKTQLSDSDEKAHQTALDLEKNAYDFYKKNLALAHASDVKTFFQWLMKQENAHFELIQKAFTYIKDPHLFMSEHEDWLFEG